MPTPPEQEKTLEKVLEELLKTMDENSNTEDESASSVGEVISVKDGVAFVLDYLHYVW